VNIWGAFLEHSGIIQRTLREHSRNIQGTFGENQGIFRKQSLNMQGPFREHSVRVEVDACESPSQLQEAHKESTKVDAEYNLPTWVPKTRVNIQGTFSLS
jgi:hypothetical protein